MRARVLLAAAVAVLAVISVVALLIGRDGADPADAANPAGDASDTGDAETGGPPLSGPVGRYVALGDSYTAGPLIPWMHGEPSGCLRSTRNYPAQLAQWLDVDELVDVSCSGADTGDITGTQELLGPTLPPQLDAVTADTDLVTIGIGGNDYRVFSQLVSGSQPPGLLEAVGRIGAAVADVVTAVQDRAPDAVVAVVGYPSIVPSGDGCEELPFDAAANSYVDQVEQALNLELEQAAIEEGAVYIDTFGPSQGHDICAGDEAWINGSSTDDLRALAFHPFESGMRGTATAVYEGLRGTPPTPADRRQAAAALAARPNDALTRQVQRLTASLLGG